MVDDLTKRRPQDAQKVNVHEQYELDYWTNKFGVTEAELKAAVAAVGVWAADVAKRLGKSL